MSDKPDRNEQDIQDSRNSANANKGDAHCNNNKNNVNPSFNNTNQLIGINITNLIVKPNDKITDLVSNKKKVGAIIISITAIALFGVFGTFAVSKLSWQKSNSSVEENSSEKKILSTQNKSSLVILQNVASSGINQFSPDLLPILDNFWQETNELITRKKIERAIRNYNLLITVTDKFQKYLNTDPAEFEDLEAAKEKVTEISTKAKKFRESKINEHRLSELEKQLKKQEFGKIVYLMPQQLENQYTEGAIQTTYKILMRPYGFHADRNNDGFIDSESEAEKIPCKTFAEIDRLWRDYTGDRCGWYEQSWYEKKGSQYDSQWISSNYSCDELTVPTTVPTDSGDIEYQSNITLLATIFPRNNWHFIKSKFTKKCLGLSPKNQLQQ